MKGQNDKSIGSFLGYIGCKEFPFLNIQYIPMEDTNNEEMEGTLLHNNMSVTVTMQIIESIHSTRYLGLLYQAVGMK